MRRLFNIVVALLMIGLLNPALAAGRELPKPQLIALYFYADWCPNCKILTPKFDEARKSGGFDEKDILFVKMNLTDKASIHQSILLAQGLGIGDYLKAQGSASGYVALLDAKSKKEITRFDRESTSESIAGTISKNLKP